MGLVPLALAPGKVGARAVLGRDRAHSERANVIAVGQRRGLDNFAPGEHSIAGEERRDMPAAIDRRDMEGVGEAVETQRPSERDHMPAIDEPPPEAPLPLAELVEMHLGGVLIEPGRRLVLGLFDGDAVDMIDPLAGAIVLEPVRRSAELRVERGAVDRRTSCAETFDGDRLGQFGNMGLGRGGAHVALSNHHPAHVVDDRLAALIGALSSAHRRRRSAGSSSP